MTPESLIGLVLFTIVFGAMGIYAKRRPPFLNGPRGFSAQAIQVIVRHPQWRPLSNMPVLHQRDSVPARIVWTWFCTSGYLSHDISLEGFQG